MKQERVYKKAHISVLQGRSKATDFILSDAAGIGRDERNEIAIFKDEGVAQYHARIKRSDGEYTIEGTSDGLGTFLNHQMIARADATGRMGDVIGVGKAKLIFRYSEKAKKEY